MDKQTLIGLREDAQRRYDDLVKERNLLKGEWDEKVNEIGRTQGDYRTIEKLIESWVDKPKKTKE